MAERPILFSAPMVRAILASSKTQTRRALRVQPPKEAVSLSTYHHPDPRPHFYAFDGGALMDFAAPCPHGAPGDRLWVRETHAKIIGQSGGWIETDYRATYTAGDRLGDTLGVKKRWTPAIHMPRAASRILLEVTDVRVERLQSISEADAIAEGCVTEEVVSDYDGAVIKVPAEISHPSGIGLQGWDTARDWYADLWESINGETGPASWDANPWVWVIRFRRV